MRLLAIYITLLFVFTNLLILDTRYTIRNHLDNVADAFCYSGHVIIDGD